MDSSYSSDKTSISTSSNTENENKVSIMFQSKRARFFKTYQLQDFSLPDNVMFYITKNPSTFELYQKMIQTCKDFFVKNPILVISNLEYTVHKWLFNGKPVGLDKLTCKFWITSKFRIVPDNSINNNLKNIASSICPKLYRCDIKILILHDQIISFADICRLISLAERIDFSVVSVKENDGSIFGIEKIVEVAVNAKNIVFYNPPIRSITSKTVKELIKIPNFSKLDNFDMFSIHETFDIEDFYVYMKKNQHTSFSLEYNDSISEAYKNRIVEIIDEIIATKVLTYKPPFIRFPGISRKKEDELYYIFCNE